MRENQFPDLDRYQITININSNRRSELDYIVTVSEGQSTAIVVSSTELDGDGDFVFGITNQEGVIFSEDTLLRNNTNLQLRGAFINNDVNSEETEEVTLVISLRTVQDVRENPECLTDDENPDNYYCFHTVSIIDEDGQLLMFLQCVVVTACDVCMIYHLCKQLSQMHV